MTPNAPMTQANRQSPRFQLKTAAKSPVHKLGTPVARPVIRSAAVAPAQPTPAATINFPDKSIRNNSQEVGRAAQKLTVAASGGALRFKMIKVENGTGHRASPYGISRAQILHMAPKHYLRLGSHRVLVYSSACVQARAYQKLEKLG